MTVEDKKNLLESLKHELCELMILKSKSFTFPTGYYEKLITQVENLKLELSASQEYNY